MQEMLTMLTDVHGVCQSVCLSCGFSRRRSACSVCCVPMFVGSVCQSVCHMALVGGGAHADRQTLCADVRGLCLSVCLSHGFSYLTIFAHILITMTS